MCKRKGSRSQHGRCDTDESNPAYMDRREKNAKADSVSYGNPDIRRNFYVFLNTLGRPLSENLWNKNLTKIANLADTKTAAVHQDDNDPDSQIID